MKRITVVVAGVIVGLLLCAFAVKVYLNSCPNPSAATIISLGEVRAAAAYNRKVIDSAIHLVRSGNVVLRSGLGADSYMLSHMNQRDRTYSHCGIVMIENGYPFVYHCIGGEDNSDERLRRDSAQRFFSPYHNDGIAIVSYNLNAVQLAALTTVVQNFYKARPRFDMQFDMQSDDQLYCSEFVYKAFNRAMNDTGYIKPSKALGHTFVGIDDLFLNPHAHLIWQMKFK